MPRKGIILGWTGLETDQAQFEEIQIDPHWHFSLSAMA